MMNAFQMKTRPTSPTSGSSSASSPTRILPTTGNTFWTIGHKVTILVAEKDYSYIDIVSPPHIPGPPPHLHEDASELFHVIEGKYDVFVEGEWMQLSPGESVLVPRNKLHSFQNAGRTDARMISVFSPGGFHAFFRDLGFSAQLPNAFEKSIQPSSIDRVVRECNRYGMVISAKH